MRAARLLQILLILQNRGRQSSAQLSRELEVSARTILRDVDAMTEAGLPIIVHQGNGGGIELGFNYRSRLTGLTRDEAEALGLILGARNPMIGALGLEAAAARARAKLLESFPDQTRAHAGRMLARFRLGDPTPEEDARIAALAGAIRDGAIVRLRHASPRELCVHPIAMALEGHDWRLHDQRGDCWISRAEWGRVNISAHRFDDGRAAMGA